MIIRKAKEKDIPRILELLEQVLQIHADIRPDIFIPGTTKYTIDELRELLKHKEKPIDGVDCFGYITWGPFDMLSSSGDMNKRYGFIFVNRTNDDLRDMKRFKKKSFAYMKKVYKSNGEEI